MITSQSCIISELYCTLWCIQPILLPTTIKVSDIPPIEYISVCSIFDSSNEDQPMILIIEERLKELPNEFRTACQVR